MDAGPQSAAAAPLPCSSHVCRFSRSDPSGALAGQAITKMVRRIVLEVDPNNTPIAAGDTCPFAHVVIRLLMPPETHGALLV